MIQATPPAGTVFRHGGDGYTVRIHELLVGRVSRAHGTWWTAVAPNGAYVNANGGPYTRQATRHLWPSRADAARGLAARAGLDPDTGMPR